MKAQLTEMGAANLRDINDRLRTLSEGWFQTTLSSGNWPADFAIESPFLSSITSRFLGLNEFLAEGFIPFDLVEKVPIEPSGPEWSSGPAMHRPGLADLITLPSQTPDIFPVNSRPDKQRPGPPDLVATKPQIPTQSTILTDHPAAKQDFLSSENNFTTHPDPLNPPAGKATAWPDHPPHQASNRILSEPPPSSEFSTLGQLGDIADSFHQMSMEVPLEFQTPAQRDFPIWGALSNAIGDTVLTGPTDDFQWSSQPYYPPPPTKHLGPYHLPAAFQQPAVPDNSTPFVNTGPLHQPPFPHRPADEPAQLDVEAILDELTHKLNRDYQRFYGD